MRAALASIPATPGTAGERSGLWLALLDVDSAREAAEEMPAGNAFEVYLRAAAIWLADFVSGTTHPLEPLDQFSAGIDDAELQVEAIATTAVNRARVAVSEGQDWQAPLAAIRHRLGDAPNRVYTNFLWRPVFRTLLITTTIGVIVFWLALYFLTIRSTP